MGSGSPVDDWKDTLEDIRNNNKWFRVSTKIAISFGEQADISALAEVVDNNPKAVISVDDVKMFENLIPDVTITAIEKRFHALSNDSRESVASEIVENIKRKFGIEELQLDKPDVEWEDGWRGDD